MFFKTTLLVAIASATIASSTPVAKDSVHLLEEDWGLASGGWPGDAASIEAHGQALKAASLEAAGRKKKSLRSDDDKDKDDKDKDGKVTSTRGYIRQESILSDGRKMINVFPLGSCQLPPPAYRYYSAVGIYYYYFKWINNTLVTAGFPTNKCEGVPILELSPAPELPYPFLPGSTMQSTTVQASLEKDMLPFGYFQYTYNLAQCGGPATGYKSTSIPAGRFSLACTALTVADPLYSSFAGTNAVAYIRYAADFPAESIVYAFNDTRCFKSGFAPVATHVVKFANTTECNYFDVQGYNAYGMSAFKTTDKSKGPTFVQ